MGHVLFLRKGLVHTAPVTGVKAGSLAVGSVVKLMEGSTAVEYLVVHQGKPSDLYDDSCDGTWLMRKDLHSKQTWSSSNVNKYETSDINTWLNGDFFNSLGSVEQAVIKQVKIPYRKNGGSGGTNQSGANGLSCKVFLLGGYELGLTVDRSDSPIDGDSLSFFNETGAADSKRIAYLNGTASYLWTRSQDITDVNYVWRVSPSGGGNTGKSSGSYGARPALVLPSTALFDKDTLLLKGAA